MKRCFCILPIVFLFISCYQNIPRGRYCFSFNTGFSSNCFELRKNNYFSWKTSGDMGTMSQGNGIYQIKGDSLYLKFKKDSVNFDSTAEVLEVEHTVKDTVSLNLELVDHYGQPLAAVDIVPNESPEKEYRTDLDGKLIIGDIPKSDAPRTYQTPNLLGFENYKFSFVPSGNVTLLVTLHPQKPKLISDKIIAYEIIDLDKERLVLKNTSGQVHEFDKVD